MDESVTAGEGISFGLEGCRALVTGGSRGVGRATALLLARAGASVGIGYHTRRAEAAAVVEALRHEGQGAWAHGADLRSRDGAAALVERAREEFGSIDVLVGNHGIWPPEDVPIQEMTEERWSRTLSTNLDSLFHLLHLAVPLLTDGGSVVLVSSTAGQRGEAFHADYAATKGAVISLAKGLSGELAPRGITVNAVAPGWIDTEMAEPAFRNGGRERIERSIPLGRIASPEDIAGPIVFLASPFARHVTGEVLNVNGGAVLVG